MLWDHRRIFGPSLTEMSLCGTYLYCETTVYAALRYRGHSLCDVTRRPQQRQNPLP